MVLLPVIAIVVNTLPPLAYVAFKFVRLVTTTASCMVRPTVLLSTYSFVAASFGCVGPPTCAIRANDASITPLGPPGTRTILTFEPDAVIVRLPVDVMFEVNTLFRFASPVTTAFAPTKKPFAVTLPFAIM